MVGYGRVGNGRNRVVYGRNSVGVGVGVGVGAG